MIGLEAWEAFPSSLSTTIVSSAVTGIIFFLLLASVNVPSRRSKRYAQISEVLANRHFLAMGGAGSVVVGSVVTLNPIQPIAPEGCCVMTVRSHHATYHVASAVSALETRVAPTEEGCFVAMRVRR